MKQEIKISVEGVDIFFFAHSGKSAMHYAEMFYSKNKKYNMKLYILNESSHGNKWIFIKENNNGLKK